MEIMGEIMKTETLLILGGLGVLGWWLWNSRDISKSEAGQMAMGKRSPMHLGRSPLRSASKVYSGYQMDMGPVPGGRMY